QFDSHHFRFSVERGIDVELVAKVAVVLLVLLTLQQEANRATLQAREQDRFFLAVLALDRSLLGSQGLDAGAAHDRIQHLLAVQRLAVYVESPQLEVVGGATVVSFKAELDALRPLL